jgi:hypothetical protein
MKSSLKYLAPAVLLVLPVSLSFAQQPTAQERVVALKASLAASQVILKQYEWVETTTVSVKGDQKSQQMNRCYYGAEGNVQKVPLTSPPQQKKPGGLRGLIAEKKQEEMTDYMKSAVALVKEYIPPQPVLIQNAKDAGKVSVSPLPGQRVRLTFTDFIKPGDSLALDLDLANNRPMEAKVTTYLEDAKDEPVTLDVKFSTLPNNATYASTIDLNAQAKQLTVNVQNSGYRNAGN